MGFALTLVYVAFVFLRPQELYYELAGLHVMVVMAAVAMLATGLSLLTGGSRPLLVGPEWRLAVAFILWCSLSVALAIRWYGGAWATLTGLTIPLFTLVLILLNVSTRRRLAALVGALWLCGLVLLGQAFRAYYSGAERSPFFITAASRGSFDDFVAAPPPEEAELAPQGDVAPGSGPKPPVRRRPDLNYVKRIQALGFLADPNDFAQYLVCLVPLLGLAWRRGSYFRNTVLVLLPTAIASWGVVLTRSRGGMVAAAGMLLAAFIFRLGPRWRRPVGVATVLVAMPAFVALFGYARADESSAGRIEAWSAGLAMLKSSPVWGVGHGQFMDLHGRVAHNSLVQCFAETGLVGYTLWLGFIALGLMRVSSLADGAFDPDWRRWGRALRISMIGFLLAALFLSRTTSPLLFLLVALLAVLSAMAQREGERVAVSRYWWLVILAVEAVSVLLVWMTSRAYY